MPPRCWRWSDKAEGRNPQYKHTITAYGAVMGGIRSGIAMVIIEIYHAILPWLGYSQQFHFLKLLWCRRANDSVL
jgi:hypothetical protein